MPSIPVSESPKTLSLLNREASNLNCNRFGDDILTSIQISSRPFVVSPDDRSVNRSGISQIFRLHATYWAQSKTPGTVICVMCVTILGFPFLATCYGLNIFPKRVCDYGSPRSVLETA